MKKDKSGLLWGSILILAGIFIAGKSFGFLSFSLFFRGWWTLFIIIPCFIGLFNGSGKKSSNVIGLAVGIMLLLTSNRLFPSRLIFPLGFAGFCIYMGMRFLKSGKGEGKNSKTQYYTGEDWDGTNYDGDPENGYYSYDSAADAGYAAPNPEAGNGYSSEAPNGPQDAQGTGNWEENSSYEQNTSYNKQYQYTGYQGYDNSAQNRGRTGRFAGTAVLAGKTVRFDNQLVTNGMFSAVLGGIDLDLRRAIIHDSVVIEAKVLLGGIDILVPKDVRVVVNCTPILGGVDDWTTHPPTDGYLPTIYINGTCVLGGIDVKYK